MGSQRRRPPAVKQIGDGEEGPSRSASPPGRRSHWPCAAAQPPPKLDSSCCRSMLHEGLLEPLRQHRQNSAQPNPCNLGYRRISISSTRPLTHSSDSVLDTAGFGQRAQCSPGWFSALQHWGCREQHRSNKPRGCKGNHSWVGKVAAGESAPLTAQLLAPHATQAWPFDWTQWDRWFGLCRL